MKTKLLLTLLISLSVFLTGCGKEVKQTNDSLTVYVNWNYKKPMELATKIFQEKYPEIEVTLIDGVKLTGPEIDEESTRVATELMAGAGPDVFLLETQWDLDKMIDKGVFADLSQFYEESECFKSDNWEDKIIDGGRRGDYRFCIPVEYGIPLLVTSKTALEKSGINIENMQDFQGFMKETTAYMEHRKAGVEGPRLFRMDGTVVPRTCIMWSNLPFIDWNMQTTNLEREEVKNFFAWCALVEEQWEQDYYSDSFNDFLGAASIRDGVALFDNQRGVFLLIQL